MSSTLPPLWHYTCDHSQAELGDTGTLLPTADRADVSSLGISAWPSFFVWVTDLAEPDRHALGLTQNYIRCDRTAHRYRVTDDTGIVSWQHILDTDPGYASVAQLLESPGADPSHWFVSKVGVPVEYDPLPLFDAGRWLTPADVYARDFEAVSAIVNARWSS